MPLIASNGARIDALAIGLSEAESAVYVVQHIESLRVYVGMTTKNVAKRWLQHQRDVNRKTDRHFINSLRKYGSDAFRVFVVHVGMTFEQLCIAEKQAVAKFAANSRAHGFNSTDGGDSYKHTDEVRRKISESQKGREITPSQREKISASMKLYERTEEHRRNNGLARRGWKMTDEQRLKLSVAHRGHKPSQETLSRMSEAHKIRFSDPEYRERHRQILLKAATPEVVKRRADALRKKYEDPEFRQKSADAARERVANMSEETREKLRAAANRRWSAVRKQAQE